MSTNDYKGSLRAALDLAAFAKRMDEEMAKHDCHGFGLVIMAVAQEVLGLNSAPVGAGGVDERAAFEAIDWLDDFVARCNGDDRGSCVSVNIVRTALQARAALTASAQSVPSVQITGHLDEVDAPVWEFINAEARKLGPLTGSIDSYGLSRPSGGQPNGGVVVLWNGQKIQAVAMAFRDAMNRTQCVRLLAEGLATAGAQSVPDGWKLVPVEATTEMVEALKARIACTSRGGILNAGNALNDAIAAAPAPGKPGATE